MKVKANGKDDAAATFAGPERDARVRPQKDRLTGLRFSGEEECSHSSYDISLTMLETEKFLTRRNELLQKKAASKEIPIDQSQLVVKDKQSDLTCPTVTELEVSNALKRRALAFDLVGVCTYDVMAAYHAGLRDHLHTPPPPGYSAVSVQQILRADRAAFMFLSERLTSLVLEKECHKPIAYGPCTAYHPESANHSFSPVATVRSDPKSFFDEQGIQPQEKVKKPSQAANSERKRWTKGSQRQKSWSEHSSGSDQQSIRNSSETAPVLGIQLA